MPKLARLKKKTPALRPSRLVATSPAAEPAGLSAPAATPVAISPVAPTVQPQAAEQEPASEFLALKQPEAHINQAYEATVLVAESVLAQPQPAVLQNAPAAALEVPRSITPDAAEVPAVATEVVVDSEEEASESQEMADSADVTDTPQEVDPSEAAWAGMPEEGWADDGRWSDEADVDVGQPMNSMPAIPSMEQEEPAAQESAGGYASTAQDVAPVERTAEGDLWQNVVEQLLQTEAVAALARQLALQSQLIARDGDLWHLRVDSSSLNQTGSRDRLRAALEAAGHARQLHVELGPVTDTPARRLAFEKKTHQLLAEDIVKSNSLVQTLRRDFGAKIVPGSIKPLSIQPE